MLIRLSDDGLHLEVKHRVTLRAVRLPSGREFPEILIVFVEHLPSKSPDCRVFAIREVGERNSRRGIDDFEPVTGQQHDTGFFRKAKQKTDS